MKVAVGCPVARREWIIRRWADHVLVGLGGDVDPVFVVVAHPDDPTPGILRDHLGGVPLVVVPDDVARDGDRRDWVHRRFAEMVTIRNLLLQQVRDLEPDVFLSIDSDILLHPEAFPAMVGMLDRFDAAGAAVFLSHPPAMKAGRRGLGKPSYTLPNFAMLTPGQKLHRIWRPGATCPVDVLMALKLMTPAAYQVDYAYHDQGEDTGWSLACRDARVRLGWTSTVVSKHVMLSRCPAHRDGAHDPACPRCVELVERLDPRCGY